MSISKCVSSTMLLLALAISISAQQKAGTLKLKPYTFENAKGEKVESEFGTLLVPENRSNPQSNLIELAFVRFKSLAKNPGPPIVYLAGGPGGSGIFTAKGSRFPLFMALRDVADSRGGVRALSRDARLNRESLYRMLSKSGNPSLDSLAAVLKAFGLRLAVQPTTAKGRKGRAA